MKKRLLGIMVLIVLALALVGCGGKEDKPKNDETEKQNETQSNNIEEDDCDAVTELMGMECEFEPTLMSLNGTKAIICNEGMDKTNVVILDTKDNKVISERELTGSWSLKATFTDGRSALYSFGERQWLFLDSQLKDAGTGDYPYGVVFNHDGSKCVSAESKCLMVTDTVTGITSPALDSSKGLYVTGLYGISRDGNKIAFNYISDPRQNITSTGVYDLDSDEFVMLSNEAFMSVAADNGFVFMNYNDADHNYTYSYMDDDGAFRRTGEGVLKDVDVTGIPGSRYFITSYGEEKLLKLSESLYGCDFSKLGINAAVLSGCMLDNGNVIVYTSDSKIYKLNPKKIEFEKCADAPEISSPMMVNSSVLTEYFGEYFGKDAPKTMEEVKAYRDRIQDKYGVTILISDECAEAKNLSNFPVETTAEADLEDELFTIANGLNNIDRSLSLYPKEMFAEFKKYSSGVRFFLIGNFNGTISTGGQYVWSDDYYNIILDSKSECNDNSVCHEFWHATEDFIDRTSGFTWDEFENYNPGDFSYVEELGGVPEDTGYYTLFGGGDEGVYFIDSYGEQSALEDKARIMEFVMTRDAYHERMMASPALKGKLSVMCEGIRCAFDTSSWGSMYWEEVLNGNR